MSLVSRRHEELEADFIRYYNGLDLLDFWRGKITGRRMSVLIRQLPRESEFKQAELGPTAQWGATEHLIASVLDVLRQVNWNYSRFPQYEPVWRPGDEVKANKRAEALADQARRVVARRAAREAAKRAQREGGDGDD